MKTTNKTIAAATFALMTLATMAGTASAGGPDQAKNTNRQKTFQQVPAQKQHHQEQGIVVQQQQQFIDPGFNPSPAPRLGFTGQMIYGYGMKVLSVAWGTPAQRIGLETGDVIVRINGRQIRSQFDYDQALRDAATYNGGQVNLLVRNVRFDWGWNVAEYASSTTTLDGFAQQQGPIGPQSTGPLVAARQQ